MPHMNKLVLLRHGQSQWNLENRFTGWKDVPLPEKGINEANNAGHLLKKHNIKIDYSAIVSFEDPSANFGLILQKSKIHKEVNKKLETNISEKDNVINFSNYKKN